MKRSLKSQEKSMTIINESVTVESQQRHSGKVKRSAPADTDKENEPPAKRQRKQPSDAERSLK